jgi:dTDP-4-dehydrorhamnose 3,5-epimerase
MVFKETKLRGVYIIDVEPIDDERGHFARTYCEREFKKRGLTPCAAQCNTSFNRKRGTLRGIHFQAEPHSEAKLVTCLTGAIYDVIIDLRPQSPTFREWLGLELSARRPRSALYIPKNFAHGFQTLADDTEVLYQMSEFYQPESARGVRWNDPAFNINWPEAQRIISDKDLSYPDFIE